MAAFLGPISVSDLCRWKDYDWHDAGRFMAFAEREEDAQLLLFLEQEKPQRQATGMNDDIDRTCPSKSVVNGVTGRTVTTVYCKLHSTRGCAWKLGMLWSRGVRNYDLRPWYTKWGKTERVTFQEKGRTGFDSFGPQFRWSDWVYRIHPIWSA